MPLPSNHLLIKLNKGQMAKVKGQLPLILMSVGQVLCLSCAVTTFLSTFWLLGCYGDSYL